MTLLPEYRAQLYSAAEARARRRPVTVTRHWPVVVSTAVALVVVAVAVAVLSPRHPASRPAHSGPAPAAEPLTDMLGVLRRPQTNADRHTWVPGFFNTFASPGCHAAGTPLQCTMRLDRPLIREVAVPGPGYRVGLLPYTSRGRIAGVAVTLRGPGVNYLAAGPWSDRTTIPPGLSGLRTHGLMLPAYVSVGVNRDVIVVPDGVARVAIGPVHLLNTAITARVTPTQGATAVVHDNVALLQLSGLSVKNLRLKPTRLRRFFSEGSGSPCRPDFAIYALPATAIMTWLGPNGPLFNPVRINFPVYVGTHHPAPGSTVPTPGCGTTG